MDRHENPAQAPGGHLVATTAVDLTRHRGQGNGLRIHVVIFGLVSLAGLVAFVTLIATASTHM